MTTIIIGGGASGLACAIKIKQIDYTINVIILERLEQIGRKILATGNGRCNLSNINAPSCKKVLSFFESIGIKTRTDDEGRIYPYSNQAATVLDVLEETCKKSGVKIITNCTVLKIQNNLCVETNLGIFNADNIVVATGGMAQKNLGSDGSGYDLLTSLGHSTTNLIPALVQLNSSSKYPRLLKGQRVKCNMSLSLDEKIIDSQYGEILFTDYGISGIVTMNLSHIASENFASVNPKKCHAVLDLIPEMCEKEILDYLKKFKTLTGILGTKLSDIIIKQSDNDFEKAAKVAKNWKLIITGTKGYDFAQITHGGIKLDELDGYESKKCFGVYICGEILDKQFECGGYNLNFAWLSGIQTAESITGIKYDKN